MDPHHGPHRRPVPPGLLQHSGRAQHAIAIGYHSLAAVPFGTIVVLLLIWLLLSFPLCLLGTVQLASLPQGSVTEMLGEPLAGQISGRWAGASAERLRGCSIACTPV